MKKQILKNSVISLIFLILVFFAFMLVQPAYLATKEKLLDYQVQLLNQLEEQFGISISYESLSPAILSTLRISRIEVKDSLNNLSIIQIEKAHLKYSIFKLIRGEKNVFDTLYLDGVLLNWDSENNSALWHKIKVLLVSNNENQAERELPAIINSIINKSMMLPFDINIKKISMAVLYGGSKITSEIKLFDIKTNKKNSTIEINVKGDAGYTGKNSKSLGFLQNISSNFEASLVAFPDISGSSLKLHLSSLETPALAISSFDVIGMITGGEISVSFLQNMLPIHASGIYDMESGDLNLTLDADNFNPFELISIDKENLDSVGFSNLFDTLAKINRMKLSGKYGFEMNTKSKNISYSASGGVSLDESFLPNFLSNSKSRNMDIGFNLAGNKSSIDVKNLDVNGSMVDASFIGTVNLKTFMPQGLLEVNSFKLKNGNSISAEAYFDSIYGSKSGGVICYIPQLDLSGQLFSAVQVTLIPSGSSYDFSFEAYDYSHIEFGEPGAIRLDGSYITDDSASHGKFAQAGISFENVFVDSIVKAASFFIDKKNLTAVEKVSSYAEPYIFSNDMYVSTDFESVSYNAPYALIANTKKDGQVLLFSFDGNESSIQFSQFNLVFGKQSVQAEIQADISADFSDVIFSSSFTYNSIPYNVSGSFIPGVYASLAGDYGLYGFVDLSDKQQLSGELSFDTFPISIGNYVLAFSTDTSFSIPENKDWSAVINRFEVEEVSGKMSLNPFMSLVGTAGKYGLMCESVVWKDDVSVVEGTGAFSWDIADGVANSLSADVNMGSTSSSEKYSFSADIYNPEKKPLSLNNLMKDFYFSCQADISDFPSSRIAKKQEKANVINCSFSALGTLENPSVSLKIFDSTILFENIPLQAALTLRLEDKSISLSEADIQWSGIKASGLEGLLSLRDFTGNLESSFSLETNFLDINIPMSIALSSSEAKKSTKSASASEKPASSILNTLFSINLPKSIAAEINLPGITGSFFDPIEPMTILFTAQDSIFEISGGPEDSIAGFYDKNGGDIVLSFGGELPFQFNAAGSIKNQNMDVQVSSLKADLSVLSKLINRKFFALYSAIVTGDVHLGGMVLDPEFSGNLTAENLEIGIPAYIVPHLSVDKVDIKADQKQLIMQDCIFTTGGNDAKTDKKGISANKLLSKISSGNKVPGVNLNLIMTFDRWILGNLFMNIKTLDNSFVAAQVNVPYIDIASDASCDLTFNIRLDGMDFSGSVFAQDSAVSIYPAGNENSNTENETKHRPYNVNMNLDVTVGQRVQMYMYWPTKTNLLMRAIASPMTKVKLKMDSATGAFNINSNIELRGGEIIYFQRNFYLREGRIVFDDSMSGFDPALTLRAEIRERDDSGNLVKITMSAENQRLSALNPSFSSSPAKSEQEMMTLLGQAAVADLSKAQTAGQAVIRGMTTMADYGLQITMFRKLENALRDLLKTDIFSIKLSFLQNAAVLAYEASTTGKQIKASNFLDNSTVYIGKYLGNSIYFDSLLHVSYDETLVQSDKTVGGLVFQPEIGIEMTSPFTTIRWSLAPEIRPDLAAFTKDLLVPAVSISFSWKIVF